MLKQQLVSGKLGCVIKSFHGPLNWVSSGYLELGRALLQDWLRPE